MTNNIVSIKPRFPRYMYICTYISVWQLYPIIYLLFRQLFKLFPTNDVYQLSPLTIHNPPPPFHIFPHQPPHPLVYYPSPLPLLQVKLPYDPVCPSLGWSVGHNFCINFLKRWTVSLPCSFGALVWMRLLMINLFSIEFLWILLYLLWRSKLFSECIFFR